jgi:quinoprotein glucose dehydrogenase
MKHTVFGFFTAPLVRVSALLVLSMAAGLSPARASDWQHYGGDEGGSHYSALTQINRDNVGELQQVWQYRTGDIERHPEYRATTALNVTPIITPKAAGESLVLCAAMNRVIALDPVTAAERWVYDPEIDLGKPGEKFLCRGVAYWEDTEAAPEAACKHRIFSGTKDLRLLALDARSGELCEGFGDGGTVNVKPAIYSEVPDMQPGDVSFAAPPVTLNDLVIVGSSDNTKFWRADSPSGKIRAFDARSGKLRWSFDPLPRMVDGKRPPQPEFADWTAAAMQNTGGANTWSMMSVDSERQLIFIPTATAGPNNYGGLRPGDNRYANSVVALNADDGSVAWHFQIVHHDVWDLDPPAQPMLVDLEKDGATIPVVIQLTKQGLIFVLHRETGVPVFPVEERPVPTDGVPGEVLSPTQPFPTKPAPLGRMGISPDDAFGFTFVDRNACRDKIAAMRNGSLYEPPSFEGTALMPGASIMNWGGAAFDPVAQRLLIPLSNTPMMLRLTRNEDVTDEIKAQPRMGPIGPPQEMRGTAYSYEFQPIMSPMFSPCTAPPWGEFAAVDMRGDTRTAWRITLGTLEGLMPIPVPLEFGTPLSGGPLATATGVVFIGAGSDQRFRAFNTDNGELLWETKVPAPAQATPMTYEIDGVQYVVVAAGGHMFTGFNNVNDYLVAFALPKKP